MTIKAPPITESAFLTQVLELAAMRGWATYHPRPARTLDSWRTAGTGTMAKGYPDLTMARGNRLIFVELKRDGGKLTSDQERVLGVLRATCAEVYVFRPNDWNEVERTLR